MAGQGANTPKRFEKRNLTGGIYSNILFTEAGDSVKNNDFYVIELIDSFLYRRRSQVEFSTDKRPFAVLSYRLKGSAVFRCGTDEISAEKGSVTYIPPDTEYSQLSQIDDDIIVIHFNTDKPLSDKIEVFLPSDGLCEKLFNEAYCHSVKGERLKALSKLYEILSAILTEDKYNGVSAGKISAALDYINEHFTDSTLDIRCLAMISDMSETHFRSTFKKVTGVSPYGYITEKRIDFAASLLRSGYYSVAEVARKSGFYDIKNFSVAFKKKKGLPPSHIPS